MGSVNLKECISELEHFLLVLQIPWPPSQGAPSPYIDGSEVDSNITSITTRLPPIHATVAQRRGLMCLIEKELFTWLICTIHLALCLH
jgi:hypothetical protein